MSLDNYIRSVEQRIDTLLENKPIAPNQRPCYIVSFF